MGSNKRKFSDNAKAFSKRMKIPMVTKKFVKPSNLNLNQISPELKYIDVEATDTAVPNGATTVDFVLINGVAQGSDNTNRVGRKVLAKSLDINAIFIGPTSNTQASASIVPGSMVRWWVILDAQPDGATATPADVWKTTSSFAVAHRNLDNSERFKVLRTGTVCLSPMNQTAATPGLPGYPDKGYVDIFIPLNDAVRYSGTGATIASIASGAYYFCYCCDSAAPGSGAATSVVYDTRFKFTDE